jgi:hypothetical protein
MDDHPNAKLLRELDQRVTASGDMRAVFDALSEDVVWHEIGSAEPVVGRDALAKRFEDAGYDIVTETHDIVANDEHAVQLMNVTARRGDRTLHYRTAEIYHVKDGKITERWAFSDDTKRISDFFA